METPIPSIQLTSALIALNRVKEQTRLFEARRNEIIHKFCEDYRLSKKAVTDALWEKEIERRQHAGY